MPPDPRRPAPPGGARTTLHATAQLLTFEPGLYAVDFGAVRSAPTDSGLTLPCVRLEPVPAAPTAPGRAFVSVMAEAGWLSQGGQPSFVRVVGGRAGVMLTIYKAGSDMASPELRIRLLPEGVAAGGRAPSPREEERPAAPRTPGPAFGQLVHVQGMGDLRVSGGEWAGRAGSGLPLEGFALTLGDGQSAPDPELTVEYQAILGDQWNTPWMRGGQFCGSRGMSLPLLGVRIRLGGAAAARHTCRYWGSFVGAPSIGPHRDGEACTAGGAFMEALRVEITPLTAMAAPEAAMAEATPDAAPDEHDSSTTDETALATRKVRDGARRPRGASPAADEVEGAAAPSGPERARPARRTRTAAGPAVATAEAGPTGRTPPPRKGRSKPRTALSDA